MRRSMLLLVLLLAMVAAYWRWQPATGERSTAPAANGAGSGYAAVGARLVDTGDDGQPRYRLEALGLAQAVAGGEVELTSPRLESRGSVRWQLTARLGTLPEDGSRVALRGDVRARAERSDGAPLEVRTESLDVDLASRHASTAANVVIETGSARVAATGLQADMKAGVLQLESAVHGEYSR